MNQPPVKDNANQPNTADNASFLPNEEEKAVLTTLKTKPLMGSDLQKAVGPGRLWRVVRPTLESRGVILTREVRVQQGRRKYYYLSESAWLCLRQSDTTTTNYENYLSRMPGRHAVFHERAERVYGSSVSVHFCNDAGRERRPDLIHSFEDGKTVIVEYERGTNPRACLDHLLGSLGRGTGVLIVCGTKEIMEEYKRLLVGPWQRELSERWGVVSIMTATDYLSGAVNSFDCFYRDAVWKRLEPKAIRVARVTRREGQRGEPTIYELEGHYYTDQVNENTLQTVIIRFGVSVNFLNTAGATCLPREATVVTGTIHCSLKTCPRPDFDVGNPGPVDREPHIPWLMDYLVDYVGTGQFPEIEAVLRVNLTKLYRVTHPIEVDDEWKGKAAVIQVWKVNGAYGYICSMCQSAQCVHVRKLESRLDAYASHS